MRCRFVLKETSTHFHLACFSRNRKWKAVFFLKSALMSARAVLCSFIHGTRAKQAEGHLYFTLSLCGSTWYWLSLCSVAWFLPLNINIFYHWISLVFLTQLLFLCLCWPSAYCLFCPRCDACCLCVFNRILNFAKPSWADVCCVLLSNVCICSDLFLLWDVGCVPGLSVASVSRARQLVSLCHHLISTSLIWLLRVLFIPLHVIIMTV